MKVVELLKLGGEVLKLMSRNDVLRDDWRFVPMYEEFQEMRSKGVKYRECIRMLADFSSNVAGNAVWDGAVWLVSRLIKKL